MKSGKRARIIPLVALGLVIALTAVALRCGWVAGIWSEPVKWEPPAPPPEPEYALELVNAVNEYYEKEGEYPPYLLGGLAEDWGRMLADDFQPKDPLIESGILKSYHEVQKFCNGLHYTAPIQNMVSSPSDPLVVYLRGKYTDEALAVARRLKAQGKEDNWSGFPQGTDLVSEIHQAMSFERFLCGGGERRPLMHAGSVYKVLYGTRVFVDGIGQVLVMGMGPVGAETTIMFLSIASEFGYQRGEFLGGDKHTCWLWFYADKPVLTNVLGEPDKPDMWIVGLDLVDADDGLIQPDGIPDGIVLLYKLKKGKVVEVVKDYD